jgi:two-component system sensor histidine kinase FlrB
MLRRKSEDASLQTDLDRMLALVERLGRFLRHLTGYVSPEKEEPPVRIDLCQVLRELEFILREDADRRHAELKLDLPAPTLWVCSRAQHLHQIFMNLILNALQAAGERGVVQVAARSDASRVRVEVTDNGPGLPVGENARLFEPLFTTREGGTGLGLAIVKKLVEELAGTVSLANRPEGGAVAEVLLPEGSEGCKGGF